MKTPRTVASSLAVGLLAATAALVGPAAAAPAAPAAPATALATLTEVTNFGTNPSNMRMHIYVPDQLADSPAIVVAMHPCGGNGPGFYQSSEFDDLANRLGFIVIYPSATQMGPGMGTCFDTWSDNAKRRDGGSDPVAIASMVEYTLQQYSADPERVFATGSSSGGMMTNEMLALYPDLFAAGASFMGVPFACFVGPEDFPPTVSNCAAGRVDRTPQEWGDLARQAYPGYTGDYPRMQLWHGANDFLVNVRNLQEAVDQWTNLHGLSSTPTTTDTSQQGWTRYQWADAEGTVQVEAINVAGASHNLPMAGMAAQAIAFFGLDG